MLGKKIAKLIKEILLDICEECFLEDDFERRMGVWSIYVIDAVNSYDVWSVVVGVLYTTIFLNLFLSSIVEVDADYQR